MKNLTRNGNNSANFIVNSKQVNNNKILLPVVLYTKMEELVKDTAIPFSDYIVSKPALKKLEILKNAYIKDNLLLNSSLKKFAQDELQFLIVVYKKENNVKNIICKAKFSYELKRNTVKKVS